MNYVVRMILMTFILFILNSFHFLRELKVVGRLGPHLPISRFSTKTYYSLF